MAIEKVTLVDVGGSLKKINKTLVKCCESGCFHINPPPNISDSHLEAKNLRDRGVYERMIKRCRIVAEDLGVTLDENASYDDIEYNVSIDFKKYLDELEGQFNSLTEEKRSLDSALRSHGAIYLNLLQFTGLTSDFDELFACRYIKIRFGRIPTGSIGKLDFYDDRCFFFFPFGNETSYTWCLYLTPLSDANETDFLFKTLGFERTIMPDYLKGNTTEASDRLLEQMKRESDRITEIDGKLSEIAAKEGAKLSKVYAKLVALDNSYELRANVLVIGNRFHFSGYVPEREAGRFTEMIRSVGDVTVTVRNADKDDEAPVKLKNNWFFRPFEMFVKMYGLPAHDGIDPTPIVAVSYILLYGIMFGDLGQGLLIFLLGLVLSKFTSFKLAPIMTRIGLSSAFFGVVYGSVFGNEELIEPFFRFPKIYQLMGLTEPPENIFQASTLLLIAALCIGVVLVIITMLINIVVSLRNKDFESGIFGGSGLVGFVLYTAVIIGVGGGLAFGLDIMRPWYVICFILVPLVLMFFKEPILHSMGAKKSSENGALDKGLKARLEKMFAKEDGKKKPVGTFIIEGVIELFETCLTYLTNTMSFLRIGGFILSHAGLMLVFGVVANLAGEGPGYIIVQVIGNLFVTGFEGFLVGIQVLRLEFYEMFSRFFKGGGKPFNPVTISSKAA